MLQVLAARWLKSMAWFSCVVWWTILFKGWVGNCGYRYKSALLWVNQSGFRERTEQAPTRVLSKSSSTLTCRQLTSQITIILDTKTEELKSRGCFWKVWTLIQIGYVHFKNYISLWKFNRKWISPLLIITCQKVDLWKELPFKILWVFNPFFFLKQIDLSFLNDQENLAVVFFAPFEHRKIDSFIYMQLCVFIWVLFICLQFLFELKGMS